MRIILNFINTLLGLIASIFGRDEPGKVVQRPPAPEPENSSDDPVVPRPAPTEPGQRPYPTQER